MRPSLRLLIRAVGPLNGLVLPSPTCLLRLAKFRVDIDSECETFTLIMVAMRRARAEQFVSSPKPDEFLVRSPRGSSGDVADLVEIPVSRFR